MYFRLKNDSLVTFFLKQWTVFFFFASHCSVLHIALLPLHLLFTICSLSLPKNCCLVNMASYNACSLLFSHLCVFLFFFLHCLALLLSGTLSVRCEKEVEEFSLQTSCCPFVWSANSYGVPAAYLLHCWVIED